MWLMKLVLLQLSINILYLSSLIQYCFESWIREETAVVGTQKFVIPSDVSQSDMSMAD